MTGKRHKSGYISPIWGEAPTEAMYMKICLVGDVLDVITCAKFQNEILRGYDFIFIRVEFSIFLLIFEWALCNYHHLWMLWETDYHSHQESISYLRRSLGC